MSLSSGVDAFEPANVSGLCRESGELQCRVSPRCPDTLRYESRVFRQQGLDLRFGLVVVAFAEVRVDDSPLLVDQIERRPILVVVGVPRRIVVVLRDREGDAEALDRTLDVVRVAFERILGRVDAHHHQPLIAELLIPGLHVGQHVDTVDAGIGPEVDQHHLAAQLLHAQRAAIEPVVDASEIRCGVVVAGEGGHGSRGWARRERGDGGGAARHRCGEQGRGNDGFEVGEHVAVLSLNGMAVLERLFVSGLCPRGGNSAMFCVAGMPRYIGIQSVAATRL